MPTYILMRTPPRTPNPYRKWHLLAYTPVLLTAVFAGLTSAQLTSDHLGENAFPIIATALGFLVFSFWDLAIQDRWLAGIPRPAFYRLTDSYMPLLLLFVSALMSELFTITLEGLDLTQYIIVTVAPAIALIGVLLLVREAGSLGRVLRPKYVDDMSDPVRDVIKMRLHIS